jgi:hypothetical protein
MESNVQLVRTEMSTAMKDAAKAPYPGVAIVALPDDLETKKDANATTRFMRAHTFTIAWSQIVKAPAKFDMESQAEYILLLPNVGATIVWRGGEVKAPGRSVVVIPKGDTSVLVEGDGEIIRLFSPTPASLAHLPLHDAGKGSATMPTLKDQVHYTRTKAPGAPAIYELDKWPNSPGMPRAKLFQSETMSINWVEYKGPRDRKNLSPHFHTDIEQASLAVEGTFLHHYRTRWTIDADKWRDDEHITAGAGTIALIPPPIIHTSEGVGPGRQILIDVFAPPRADFIAKGQILNSGEYAAPAESKAQTQAAHVE